MPVVLLGESTPDLRIAFAMVFQRCGDTVHVAADRTEVLRLATSVGPDVIVINLPEGDGPSLCRALRAEPATAGIPILMLTAALLPDAGTARRAGADDYLTKPLENADLIERAHTLAYRASVIL